MYGRDILDLNEDDSELLNYNAYSSEDRGDLFADLSTRQSPSENRGLEWPAQTGLSPTNILADDAESPEYPPTLLELEVQALAKVGVLKLYHGTGDLERERARALKEEKFAQIQRFDRERQALSPVLDQHQVSQGSERRDSLELENLVVAGMTISSKPNVLAPRRVGEDDLLELQRMAVSNLERSQKAPDLVSESTSSRSLPGVDLLELQKVALSTMKETPDLDLRHIEPALISTTERQEEKSTEKRFEQNQQAAMTPESPAVHSNPISVGADLLELQKMALAGARDKQLGTALPAVTSFTGASAFTKSSWKLGEGDLLELQKVALRGITSPPTANFASTADTLQQQPGGNLQGLQKVNIAPTSTSQEPTVVPKPPVALQHSGEDLLELQKAALKSIHELLPHVQNPASNSPLPARDLLELQKVVLKSEVPKQSIPQPVPGQILGSTVASQQTGGAVDLLERQKAALRGVSEQDLAVLQPAPVEASQQSAEDLLELQKFAFRSAPKQPYSGPISIPDAAPQEKSRRDLLKTPLKSSRKNHPMLAPAPSSAPALAATTFAAAPFPREQPGGDLLELQKAALTRAPKPPAPAPASDSVPTPAFPAAQHVGGMGDLLQLQGLALSTLSNDQASPQVAQNAGKDDLLKLDSTTLTSTPKQNSLTQESQPCEQAVEHRGENLSELQNLALASTSARKAGELELKSKGPKQEHVTLTFEGSSLPSSLPALPSGINSSPSTAARVQTLLQELSAKDHALQSANEKIEEKNELLQIYKGELAAAAQLLDSMDVQYADSKEAIGKVLAETEDICCHLNEACCSLDCFETLPSEFCVGSHSGFQDPSSELPDRIEDAPNMIQDGHFFFGPETGMRTDQGELDERRGMIVELLVELGNMEKARREAQEGFESQIGNIEQLIGELDGDFHPQVSGELSCYYDPRLDSELITQESLRLREVNDNGRELITESGHCDHCSECPSVDSVEEINEMRCDHDYGTVIDRAASAKSFHRDAFVLSPSRETSASTSDNDLIMNAFDNDTPGPGNSHDHDDHPYVIRSDQIPRNFCDQSFVASSDHHTQALEYPCEHAFVVQSGQNSEYPPSDRGGDGQSSASEFETVCPPFHEEPREYINEIPCDHLHKDKNQSREIVLRGEDTRSVSAVESVGSPLSMGFESGMPVSDALTRVESKVLAQLQAIDTANHHQQQAAAGDGNQPDDQVRGQYLPLLNVVENWEATKLERAKYSNQELSIKDMQCQLEENDRAVGELHKRIEELQAAIVWEQENSRKALMVKTIETQSDLEKSSNIAKELRDQIHVLQRQSSREVEELRDRIHQLEDFKDQRIMETQYLHNQIDQLERLNDQRSREIKDLRDKIHHLEASLHEEQGKNQQLKDQLQKGHPPNTLSEIRVKEISDLHHQFHRLHRELRQEKEANKRALAALADTQKHQAMAARDEKVKELQEVIADKEAAWQAEKHKMRKRIDEFETGLLVKEEEIIKLAQELEIVRKFPYFRPSDGISGLGDRIGTNGATSPGSQKQYKEEESREVLDLRCEVLSLHDRLEMKTQALKTTEKELGRSYQMVIELKSKLRENQELEKSSWRPGQSRDFVRRLRTSEEKLRKFQDERAIMSKQIFDLSARCKYAEELEHLHKEEAYNNSKEQAMRDLESELERNVQIIKRMKARCTEYEARALQAEARSALESAALQRTEIRRIPNVEGDLPPQQMNNNGFTANYFDNADDNKAELEAECDRLRSEMMRYREQIEEKNKLLSQLQIDMQSQKKRQNPSPPSTTDEPVLVLSGLDGGALGGDMVSDDRKLKKPKTNALLIGSDVEKANSPALEASTLRELLREQWKLQAILEERLNTMMDYVNARVEEFEKMTPSDATSESSLEPANELNHLHVEAKLMKVQLEQQLQVLRGTPFTSFQLEEAHLKVGLEPHDGDDQQLQEQAVDGRVDGRAARGEGQPQPNVSTQNFQLLVEKLALEGSAQTLQQKTSRLLNKLTSMRSEFVQSTTGSDASH